jgi:hypothetical protein
MVMVWAAPLQTILPSEEAQTVVAVLCGIAAIVIVIVEIINHFLGGGADAGEDISGESTSQNTSQKQLKKIHLVAEENNK